jgi:hypothetical protein
MAVNLRAEYPASAAENQLKFSTPLNGSTDANVPVDPVPSTRGPTHLSIRKTLELGVLESGHGELRSVWFWL